MAKLSLSRDQRDLIGLLSGELQSQLEASLAILEPDRSQAQYQIQADQCGQFAEACESLELEGLAQAWTQLQQQLIYFANHTSGIGEEQAQLLDTWLMYFLDYLQQLNEGELSTDAPQNLAEFLANPAWPSPLTSAPALTVLLGNIKHSASIESSLPREATSDMLSLALSEDLNPELFEGLMLELPQQVSRFAVHLDEYVARKDPQALAAAQRIAHTIKGAANVVGIDGLANLMHFSEDLLEELGRQPEQLDKNLGELLIELGDCLGSMLDALVDGSAQVEGSLTLMQKLLDTCHRLHDHQAEHSTSPVTKFETLELSEEVEISPAAETSAETPTEVQAETPTVPGNLQENLANQLRVRESTAQDLLRLAGTSAISTHRLQTQLGQTQEQLHLLQQLQQRLGQLTEDLGQQIEQQDFFRGQMHTRNDNELDPLEMDRYSELHSFFHQLQEFATDSRDTLTQARQQLREMAEETYSQQQTNREAQNLLLEMRMIPAQSVEARFQRCVRQACRLTGKEAQLIFEKGETLVDSPLLQALLDPIMHLLRNSVDHGLESHDDRLAANKEPVGKIWLGFHNQGQSLVVSLRDDGAGLKREKIIARAQQLGLLAADKITDELSDGELQKLIFTPGFSTSEFVNQTSGRGIGLDMVADRIQNLNGRISLDSQNGHGCGFTLRLPMALIAEQGLLVKSGDKSLVVSSRGLVQLLYLEPEDLQETPEGFFYLFGEELLDVWPLASLAPLPGVQPAGLASAQALLIVDSFPGQRLAVAVEQVTASREMVIKPLSTYTPIVSGVIGATILGDGQVAPVVDLQQLAIDHLSTSESHKFTINPLTSLTSQLHAPLVLIVDDSLSTRRSLSQFVSDMGLDTVTAKDGFEAVEVLDQRLPALLLVDMEMPRMNGLELSTHLRARSETRNLPIVMITSRSSDKHRQLARQAGVDYYLCKPFAETELQDCINNCLGGNKQQASGSR